MTYRSSVAKRGRLRLKFIGETIAELKKVVWLSRREAVYLTMLVLLVSITVGIFLGVIDFSFTKLVDDVFLGG
jgi:preprotein translocase subunit SecE